MDLVIRSSGSLNQASSNPPAWASIPPSIAYYEKLALLCHGTKELQRNGYTTEHLSEKSLQAKQRCINCGLRTKKPGKNFNKIHRTYKSDNSRASQASVDASTQSLASDRTSAGLEAAQEQPKGLAPPARLICHFHPGSVMNKHFTCCQRHMSYAGCVSNPSHDATKFSDRQLLEQWAYHITPTIAESQLTANPLPGNVSQAQRSFLAQQRSDVRHALALDCEMGTSTLNEPELIRLSAVDYFSNETLIDSLVKPSMAMLHYNTKYSGVTRTDMIAAERSRTCIFGRDAARKRLMRFVGPETTVIVHGGQNDLTALRWIHPQIVDTFILAGYDSSKPEGGRSLKNLCSRNLGREVQVGKKGHCSLEDARATRELAHWFMEQIPSSSCVPLLAIGGTK